MLLLLYSVYFCRWGSVLPLLFISSFCGWTALVSPQHFAMTIIVFLIRVKRPHFQMETVECFVKFSELLSFLCSFFPSSLSAAHISSLPQFSVPKFKHEPHSLGKTRSFPPGLQNAHMHINNATHFPSSYFLFFFIFFFFI